MSTDLLEQGKLLGELFAFETQVSPNRPFLASVYRARWRSDTNLVRRFTGAAMDLVEGFV